MEDFAGEVRGEDFVFVVFELAVEWSLGEASIVERFDDCFVDEGSECFVGDWLCHDDLLGVAAGWC